MAQIAFDTASATPKELRLFAALLSDLAADTQAPEHAAAPAVQMAALDAPTAQGFDPFRDSIRPHPTSTLAAQASAPDAPPAPGFAESSGPAQ